MPPIKVFLVNLANQNLLVMCVSQHFYVNTQVSSHLLSVCPFSFLLVVSISVSQLFFKTAVSKRIAISTLYSPEGHIPVNMAIKGRKEAGKHTLTHTHTHARNIHTSTQSHKLNKTISKVVTRKKFSCATFPLPSIKNFLLSCLPSN